MSRTVFLLFIMAFMLIIKPTITGTCSTLRFTKWFMCLISSDPLNNAVSCTVLSFQFYRQGSERLDDLPKVTQLVSGRARTEAQVGTVLSSLKFRTITQMHSHCPPCHSDSSSSSSPFGFRADDEAGPVPGV